MRGRLRNKNRQQSQRDQTFQQGQFDAGWINDLPASDLPKGGMALLENFVGYPEYLEGRSGCQKFSDTALPGSGTVYALKQNSTSKKWVLHRGSNLYYADSAMASWTLITYAGSDWQAVTVAGDTGSQLSNVQIFGLLTTNSNAGVLYWTLTNSGSTRTVNVYKDSAKLNLVATGSIVGNGTFWLVAQNSSALYGQIQVTYSGDDTNAGNTFTGTTNYSAASDPLAVQSDLQEYEENMLLFCGADIWFVDMTNFYRFRTNPRSPLYTLANSGGQAAATPYGYRYLYTFCRIVGGTTRVTGTLVNESGTSALLDPHGTATAQLDYGEHWMASAIASGSTHSVSLVAPSGSLPLYAVDNPNPYGTMTHIGLYRTMDIGVSGTDPVSGAGNNREIYVWVGDVGIGELTYSDGISDDTLRARLTTNFGLKVRYWGPVEGDIGAVTGAFLYSTYRPATVPSVFFKNRIQYGQLVQREHLGLYNASFQYFKLADSPQIIAKSPDMLSFICSNKTYISNPNAYTDVGGLAIAPIYVLQHITVASENIGVTDWGSFTPMDNAFIAHCSDHTIRIWNSSFWSDDIASRRINQIVRLMVTGSLGIYGAGAYYLFYRTSSSDTNNILCVRYGFSRESGFGWSKVSGSAWPVAKTYTGAAQFLDANNLQRILAYDAVDGFFYWIETFTAYTGSTSTKVFKDKVATDGSGGTDIVCTARFPEWTAQEESCDLFHKESYIYDRPYDEATGYPSGFSRTLKAYTDGSATAAATITAAPAKGDLQFFDRVLGNRIQMEVQFATSGARLTGLGTLCDVFDRQAVGATAANTTDATSQATLASNLKHWLTRPINLLNRAIGSNYSLTGTAPTNVTGPDGKSYGLSFVSGASYSQSDFTSYSDFTVHFWGKSMATANKIFQITGTNSFYVQFGSATSLSINGAGNITVATVASGWHDFWIVRSGSTVSVYQNGVLLAGTVTVATARGGTTFDINPAGAVMSLYDIRVYNAALGATEITYYYADTSSTALAGNKVLPLA